jgi:hypothetical protein
VYSARQPAVDFLSGIAIVINAAGFALVLCAARPAVRFKLP